MSYVSLRNRILAEIGAMFTAGNEMQALRKTKTKLALATAAVLVGLAVTGGVVAVGDDVHEQPTAEGAEGLDSADGSCVDVQKNPPGVAVTPEYCLPPRE